MSRKKRVVIALGLIVLLFLVATGLIMPEVIRREAISWVADNTQRRLAIDKLNFNPLNGKMTVTGAVLTEPSSGEAFVSFDRLVLDVNISSVWTRSLIVDRLQLDNPAIRLVKIDGHRFNFSDLVADAPAETEAEPSGPFQFALNNFIVHGGSVDFRDLERPGISHSVRDFELALPFVGNTPALADKFVQPRLSLKVDDAPFAIEGQAKPFADTLEASLQVRLDNIDLPYYAAYLPEKRPFDLGSGKLATDLNLSYRVTRDKETSLSLSGDVVLTGVSVLDRMGEQLLFLPLAQVIIDRADLTAKKVDVDEIAVYGLELFVNRDGNGVWNYQRLAGGPAPVAAQPADAVVEAGGAAQPQVAVGAFRLRNGAVHFRDEAGKKPFVREARDVNVDLGQIDIQSGQATPLTLAMRVSEPFSDRVGAVSIDGSVGVNPPRLQADVSIDRLPLEGVDSYFPADFVGLVTAGHVDSRLNLGFESSARTSVAVAGEVGVRSLHLADPAGGDDVLNWESLQLDGIDVQLSDGRPDIRVEELSLNGFLAKILVTPTGEVNLQHMVKPSDGSPADEAGAAAAVESQEEGTDKAPAIAVERITLQDGALEFVDQHMPKTFRAKFLRLGGRINGIDSQSDAPAGVDLRGNLENRSPLIISGSIRPLGNSLFADLDIRFDAIDLSPMTPYSGNYLGYEIEKGKLYLDLGYKIDGSRLDAANHVFLDQFTFGRTVESENATSLPVKLAVALLKDSRGEIHLELPVSGSLDDPEFSVVGVVFTILRNLLVKAATAPFKLLSAMLGSGDDDFSTVSFPYGSSNLLPAEEQKLAKLADVLQQRPALKLEISGYVDRDNDPEGWRRTRLDRALKRQKLAALKQSGATVSLPEIDLTPEERSLYLEQVYRKADFPKPRNAIGLVKSLPDEEMEKLILANTPAGEEEMNALASERAEAVRVYLVETLSFPGERAFLKQDDIFRDPDDGSNRSRVGFGVAVD